MKKKLALIGIALSMLGIPKSYAEPRMSPKIIVSLHSAYMKSIDYKTLYDYLNVLSRFYSIYPGTYHIYIRDYLPGNLILPPKAAGGHIAGATAFIDAKAFARLNLDVYFGITHELAEMAVNPNLDQFYPDGTPLEICDGVDAYFNLNGHKAAYFKFPLA